MTYLRFPVTVFVFVFVFVLIGCSDEPGDPEPGEATTISGALAASDGRTGVLTLTSAASGPSARHALLLAPSWSVIAATGVITLAGTVALSDGTTATLAGSWNTDTGEISVSGGGFSFTGTITDGSLTGSFTGPGVTGVFSLQVSGVSGDLAVYCGTFTGRQPEELPGGETGTAPSNGTWNLVVGSSSVHVIGVAGEDAEPFVLEGSRSGSTVTISVPAGMASGTITGSGAEFIAGTYTTGSGDQGTFQGSAAACTAATESGTIDTLIINQPGLLPGNGRLAFDSTLVFVTALDATGHFVAAPDLIWDFPPADAFIRTNTEATQPGQQWVVLEAPQGPGTGDPPQLVTRTFTVISRSRPGVTATGTVVVYWYW